MFVRSRMPRLVCVRMQMWTHLKKFTNLIFVQLYLCPTVCSHVANEVLQFLATKNIEIVPHPPYSPDLAPCDFFQFPTMKKDLKGRYFASRNAIIGAVQAILKRPSNNDFETVFQQRKTRSKKCVALDGEYLKGDRSVTVLSFIIIFLWIVSHSLLNSPRIISSVSLRFQEMKPHNGKECKYHLGPLIEASTKSSQSFPKMFYI